MGREKEEGGKERVREKKGGRMRGREKSQPRDR